MNKMLIKFYGYNSKRLRSMILSRIYKKEGSFLYSEVVRDILKKYHGVEIGKYSMGGCFVPGLLDKYTTVGRYCSFAMNCRVLNRNHPMEYKSTHGLFFNPKLGVVKEDSIEYIPLSIGHDVWIGHNAIIMPNVKEIGTGSVIAAGAVVNKNIPPYAVAVGNPARVVRYRFEPETIKQLLASKWWEKNIDELKQEIEEFIGQYSPVNILDNE